MDTSQKNTLLVGASQVIQMGGVLLRAKIIAITLGAGGFGLYSILLSTIMVAQQLCSVGMFQSSIKELSLYHKEYSVEAYGKLSSALKKVSEMFSLIGTIGLFLVSYGLSKYFFKDESGIWYFIVAGVSIIFFCKSQYYSTLLQSTANLIKLSKASILASLLSALFSVLLVLTFKNWGVVLTIILGYALLYLFTRIFSNSNIESQKISIVSSFKLMNPILGRGFFIMLGSFSITFFTFLLNGVVVNEGVNTVGYYQAAASIMSQGLVIISVVLATEFYPRISAMKEFDIRQRAIVDELKMLMSIIIPITCLILLLAHVVVDILYTSEFVIVVTMVRIMAVSLLFRVAWMVFSYVILAEGEKYTYFIFDGLIGNGLNFIFAIIGFRMYGLNGLAFSWIISSILVSILLFFVCNRKYGTKISIGIIFKYLFYFIGVATICFLFIENSQKIIAIIASIVLMLTSMMDNNLNIITKIRKSINR